MTTRERAKQIASECIGWFSPKLTRSEAELEIAKIIERELTISDIHAQHNAEDCAKAVVAAAREQSPNQSDAEIVAATVAGSCLLTTELMRVGRERDEAIHAREVWFAKWTETCRERDEARANAERFRESQYALEQTVGVRNRRIAELEAALRDASSADGGDFGDILRGRIDAALSPAHARPATAECNCGNQAHGEPLPRPDCPVHGPDSPPSSVISSNHQKGPK